MVEVSIRGDQLHLDVLGWHKLLGFRRRLDIPLRSIMSVSADHAIPRFRFGDIRVLGTAIPRMFAVGIFWMGSPHRWVFLDVRNRSREVLTIDLERRWLAGVIVEVSDAHAAAQIIRAAAHLQPGA